MSSNNKSQIIKDEVVSFVVPSLHKSIPLTLSAGSLGDQFHTVIEELVQSDNIDLRTKARNVHTKLIQVHLLLTFQIYRAIYIRPVCGVDWTEN